MFVMCRKIIYEPIKDYEFVVKKMRNALKKYIYDSKLESLVIGVSGGIDSALCCALARPVCNELGIPLIGRSIPMHTNKEDEISRAKDIGEILCTDFKEVTRLNDTWLGFPQERTLKEDEHSRKIRIGNIMARIRMIYLYDVAQANKGMVLSTDNLTEMFLGFWTLHGDVGDYGMVQSLWKTEVYEMSEYLQENEGVLVLKDCIEATPTDGLGITNSDLDQIGASSYKEVDKILKSFILHEKDTYGDHPVIKRYHSTMFKRDNPLNLHRGDVVDLNWTYND